MGLLSESAHRRQDEAIASEIELLRGEGVVNLSCAFYLEERLANWGCGHFNNGTSTQFPLLLDRQLARTVFSIEDVSEHVHFEMLRRCGHDLLSVPFLNKRWAAATEVSVKHLGSAPPPITVPVERSFPWQYDCYRTFRNAIIDFCLECGGLFRYQVPLARLEELRRRPIEPFGSAHAKMLFGLCGAILILTEGSHGEKDLTENHLPQMVGNRVAKISDVVIGSEVREHEVAAHLWRCLAKVQR